MCGLCSSGGTFEFPHFLEDSKGSGYPQTTGIYVFLVREWEVKDIYSDIKIIFLFWVIFSISQGHGAIYTNYILDSQNYKNSHEVMAKNSHSTDEYQTNDNFYS